ncbi:hypothetical protein GCM10027199_63560 [Amycolatopsis magusensis]
MRGALAVGRKLSHGLNPLTVYEYLTPYESRRARTTGFTDSEGADNPEAGQRVKSAEGPRT